MAFDLGRPWLGLAATSLRQEARLLGLGLGGALLGLVAAYCGGGSATTPARLHPGALGTYLTVLPIPLAILFLVGRLRIRDGVGRFVPGPVGWSRAWVAFRSRYLTADKMVRALCAMVAMALVFTGFTAVKKAIPALNPYRWDEALSNVDRAIHLGRHPWEWMQYALGHPSVTRFLDAAYFAWPSVLALVLAWQAWEDERGPRFQFFVAAAGVWFILGGLLATLLSSGGPCYYGQLVNGSNPYEPLFGYLSGAGGEVPLAAVRSQAVLWERYQLGNKQLYDGISAMPSVHVAMATLFVCLGRSYSRWLVVGFSAYLCLILVGSVHLGWHYAIDGYVAIIGAVLIWKGAGVVSRWPRRTTVTVAPGSQ